MTSENLSQPADLEVVQRMAQRLVHRGPDENGSFRSDDGRCVFGFRRLSVIDLPDSHQPMSTPDGRFTLVFNGEIYNFRQLRSELEAAGIAFRTHGDTEVLLYMYQEHGPAMLEKLVGMFSLAVYDRNRQELFLARDRLGQKPLYYTNRDGKLVFASELKAIAEAETASLSLNREALLYYLTIGYIPTPHTAYLGVSALSPGSWGLVRVSDSSLTTQRYWSPEPQIAPATYDEAVDLVRHTVTQAVEHRLVSDVPLGALLSGGVDSAIIVALMARSAGKTGGVRTFTAGFEHALFDERPYAREIAGHCGTQHTELLIQPNVTEALDAVVRLYDQPFGDSSALPTWLICQQARQHVTVALAGDGGDEAFGGYDRYKAMRLAATISPITYMGIRLLAGLLRPITPLEERNRLRRFVRFADGLPYPFAKQYFTYRTLFKPTDFTRLLTDSFLEDMDSQSPENWFCDLYEDADLPDEVAQAQHHDLMTYLPDDLLVKTDIASMACSLELRAPLLDHRVVELGLGLPMNWKIHGRRGKAILADAFGDMLPPGVFTRRKTGFGIPLGDWLRNELRQEMLDTLLDPDLLDLGIFRKEALAGLINDHITGRDDHRHRLWALLILIKWLKEHS